MENSGYIKVFRKITTTPGYFSETFCRNMAWIDLLLLANHSVNYFRVRGIRVEIDRGQVGYGIDSLAKRWRWSRGKVERFLHELETDNQIVRQKTNVTTIISICNYDIYQSNDNANNNTNSKANGQQTAKQTVKQTEANNNDKNEKNDKNKEKKEKEKKEIVKPDGLTPLHNPCIKIYSDWYEKKVGVKYPFQVADAKAIQTVICYLKKAITEKNGIEARPDEILNGWMVILESFDKWDSFYQAQLKITQIAGNLTNILANIKGIKQNGRIATIRREREQAANDFAENFTRAAREAGFK